MKSALPAAKLLGAMALCLLAAAPRARADNPVSPANPISPANPAMTDKSTAQPAIVVELQKATDGLLMPSETDAPFKIVFFAHKTQQPAANAQKPAPDADKADDKKADDKADQVQPASIQELAQLAGAPDDAKIETRDLDEFFAVATTVEEWMNEDEKSTAARFAALLEILKTRLKGAQVLVWGEAEKQVAIIGEAEGGMAGVTTLVVET